MKKRLVIWGTGKSARKCGEILDDTKCEIVAYVESSVEKETYDGRPIWSVQELKRNEFD